jgi:hypothetical protein
MTVLHRITSEYIEAEDRIRISGASPTGETVSLWLTQRLLGRLLKALLNWTAAGDDAHTELKNTFAQQAARADFKHQSPVAAQVAPFLASIVDLNHSAEVMTMCFRGGDSQSAQLTLQRQDVRQWLNILHDLWRNAGWPCELWPDWMEPKPSPSVAAPQITMH